ncbi:hypothetical protein V6N12_038799 [Hibiscus sabdariffa]|uniref:Uncharacterized protein n=1 Tax=Hibiscus sabdariffa TaxID=183260 RepID=A0ABR2CAV2_9ROSI
MCSLNRVIPPFVTLPQSLQTTFPLAFGTGSPKCQPISLLGAHSNPLVGNLSTMPPRMDKFRTEGWEGASSKDIGWHFGDPVPNARENVVSKICG